MTLLFGRQTHQNRQITALSIVLLTILGVLAGSWSLAPHPLLAQEVAAEQPLHRVLILNSYHPGMVFSDQEMDGIRSTLPKQTEIFIEYMDSKREQGEAYTAQLAKLYAMKYKGSHFDTIFSLDDDALRFLLRYGEPIFANTPVVFCGVNALQPNMLDNQSNYTGVLETMDIESSIDFALRLLPQTRQVAVITDPTTTGNANRQTLKELSRSGRFSQPFIFLDHDGTGLELSQLLESLRQIEPGSIVYHADFHVDKHGNTINIETLMPLLAQNTPCPIFVHNATYLGLGALGGKLNVGFDQGKTAGILAQRIWAGTAPADIPLVFENGNRVMVDYRQITRWGISTQAVSAAAGVPEQAIVFVNKQEDFWRGRGKYVFAGLGFIVLEGALIAWLVFLLHRQRQLRREAKRAVDRFRALFDLAPFACVVNDQQGRYLMVNQAFCQITGIPREKALGHTSSEIGVILEKESVHLIKRQLAEQGRVLDLDVTISLPFNKVLHVLQASALIDWEGSPVILSATADITRIRHAERALRESEERYRDLVQGACIIILKFNTDGLLTFVNDYALEFFGFTEDELIGKHVIGTIVPEIDSNGLHLRPVVDAVCHGSEEFYDNINENITREGDRVWIHWRNRVIRDPDNRVAEIFSFGTDITKRKQAEEEQEKLHAQLLQAQKMESVGRLAGGVAHDFNNMLGVIIGHAEMVQNALGPGHSRAHNIEQILNAAHRSADLTKQLLAFARKQPIAPKVIDLNQTIFDMLAMLRRLIGEDIELCWQPGEQLWPVLLDPTQVTQILANLCINAKDAITDGGRIVIATANVTLEDQECDAQGDSIPGQYVQITVSDNGCGMDPATRERAFDPFFTTKGLGQGTGLGLAMVSGIVSQNNGFIQLDSEPGSGTTFRLFLPRHWQETENHPSHQPVAAPVLGQGTLLLVEDEQVLLDMSTSMLESLGYTVLSAASADEALRLAREHQAPIDLLITDVIMPNMNGRELAEQLLTLRPNLQILFISGYTADVIASDQNHFLEKPFTRTTLGAKVRQLLSQPPAS